MNSLFIKRKIHVTEKTHSCAATSTLSPWHTICYFKICLSCLSGLSLTIETWTHSLYVCVFQGMYVFMHAVKGTPFETPDQGKARLLTHWEQLDYGVQFTSSRKFFTISPIILYVASRHLEQEVPFLSIGFRYPFSIQCRNNCKLYGTVSRTQINPSPGLKTT